MREGIQSPWRPLPCSSVWEMPCQCCELSGSEGRGLSSFSPGIAQRLPWTHCWNGGSSFWWRSRGFPWKVSSRARGRRCCPLSVPLKFVFPSEKNGHEVGEWSSVAFKIQSVWFFPCSRFSDMHVYVELHGTCADALFLLLVSHASFVVIRVCFLASL